MTHLTIEEIIDFVSISELNQETKALMSKVNGHICKCDECLKLVRAFMMIHDEFENMITGGTFRDYIVEGLGDFETLEAQKENIVRTYSEGVQ